MTVSVSSNARKKLLEKELGRMLPKIIKMGAKKVLLFGSLATGQVGATSDIDLIVVKETDRRFLDRLDEFYSKLNPKVALDVLVYTPPEFLKMKESSSLVRRAIREGKVLYEA